MRKVIFSIFLLMFYCVAVQAKQPVTEQAVIFDENGDASIFYSSITDTTKENPVSGIMYYDPAAIKTSGKYPFSACVFQEFTDNGIRWSGYDGKHERSYFRRPDGTVKSAPRIGPLNLYTPCQMIVTIHNMILGIGTISWSMQVSGNELRIEVPDEHPKQRYIITAHYYTEGSFNNITTFLHVEHVDYRGQSWNVFEMRAKDIRVMRNGKKFGRPKTQADIEHEKLTRRVYQAKGLKPYVMSEVERVLRNEK